MDKRAPICSPSSHAVGQDVVSANRTDGVFQLDVEIIDRCRQTLQEARLINEAECLCIGDFWLQIVVTTRQTVILVRWIGL